MAERKAPVKRESREQAFRMLFAYDFDRETDPSSFYDFNTENLEEKPLNYAKKIFLGVCGNHDEIDSDIERFSVRWKMSRMSAVTRNILRLAVCEMSYLQVPPKAAINEALEICKKYDDENAPAFVNGILNKIAREKGLIDEGK
ncbi:MAG: transcription antitermination factor NusB [Clostridia bacterium]|nr:transcription antitermination factor NusB [Clostridia bacterium]